MATKKMTDGEIEVWMANQRKDYAEGRLPKWKIDWIEKMIPNWTWTPQSNA